MAMVKREYQNPCNKDGFVTATQIGIKARNDPSRHIAPPRTTIYDPKPLEIMMKNPLPIHDQFLTTTKDVYHGQKYHEHEFGQPYQPIAPSLDKVLYVKPDYSHKMSTKHFNPKPIYDKSETKDAFKARHGIHEIYGGPVPSDPVRDVFVTSKRDHVVEFNRDEPSAIRAAHPYFPTSRFVHRLFSPEELLTHETMNRIYNHKDKDVAIKLRVIPMEDPFEQKVVAANRLPSLDVRKEAPAPNDYSNQHYFFRRPLYKGCPPRVAQPVPRLGWSPVTLDTYQNPNHCFNKENHTSGFAMCMFQPKQTMAEVIKTPNMYKTESQTYGSGKPISTCMDIHSGVSRDYATNAIGEDCSKY